MKKTIKKQRTELRNGCSRTETFVSPKNYKSLRNKSDLLKDWFVECRFFDPNFEGKYPKGYQFRKRVNMYDTISERKKAVEIFKKAMECELDEKHFNPITKKYMRSNGSELEPMLDAGTAIKIAGTKVNGSEKHLKEVSKCTTRVSKAMEMLNYDFISIKDIRIFHIKNSLEYLKLPPHSYNKFRQYLKLAFHQLIEYGCIEANPCRDISKKKEIPQFREIISDAQLKYIDPYLKENYPEFYRYRMIFGYSAGRTAELFRLRKKDVDIENQEYKILIKKGQKYIWTTKIITLDAVPYWREILDLAEDDDYLFSYGLLPGKIPNNPYQITKRWERLVKKSDKIKDENDKAIKVTADFYTLKHKFLDELDALEDNTPIIPLATAMASHTSSRTTGIYATGRQARKNERLKMLKLG